MIYDRDANDKEFGMECIRFISLKHAVNRDKFIDSLQSSLLFIEQD